MTRPSWLASVRRASAGGARHRRGPGDLIADDGLDYLVQAAAGAEADQVPGEPAVRDAALHVLVTRAVGLLVGDSPYRARSPGGRDDPVGQLFDRHLLAAAEVDRPPARAVRGNEPDQGRDHVEHVTEAAHLLAGAEHGQRITPQRLQHEAREDHAVPAGLPRPDGVDRPRGRGAQAALADVRLDQALVDRLRLGVAPPRLERRADHPVVVLAQPDLVVLPVDLAG